MKAFALFLAELNDGSTHAGLTGDLMELLQAVKSTGRTGSMTLKIKIASASKGSGDVDKITIMADRKLELPKPEQPQDFFWLTDEAEPTRQHPRQHNLDLRDAQDQRGGVRPAAQQATGTYDATAHIVNALTNTDADGVITFKDVK
jgi:hypothetical protein